MFKLIIEIGFDIVAHFKLKLWSLCINETAFKNILILPRYFVKIGYEGHLLGLKCNNLSQMNFSSFCKGDN